jgi:hypothetical protein
MVNRNKSMPALRPFAASLLLLLLIRFWYFGPLWLFGTGCEGWSAGSSSSFSRRGAATKTGTTSTALGISSRGSSSVGYEGGGGGGGGGKDDNWSVALRQRLEEQTRNELVRAVVGSDVPLAPVRLVGQAVVPTGTQKPSVSADSNARERGEASGTAAAGATTPVPRGIPCAVLATTANSNDSFGGTDANEPKPCLLVPLATSGGGSGGGGRTRSNAGAKLLEFVAHQQALSKSLLLQLNGLVVNRDDGLFDNLPWPTWTVDPQWRNRDAANNPVLPIYHLAKRDAYNRMMGKDWRGKSLALRNMAARLRRAMDSSEDSDGQEEEEEEREGATSLAQRILELQIKEQAMVVADLDYQLAVGRQQAKLGLEDGGDPSSTDAMLLRLLKDREAAGQDLRSMQQQLEQLSSAGTSTSKDGPSQPPSHALAQLLESVVRRSESDNEAPYDLVKEIIGDQLNADVIGAILENTSLLDGTLSVGGAVVLRRKTPRKEMTIAGEQVSISDDEEDYGNAGVTGGETVLVECDADEAIGLAMACDVPLQVESNVLERGSVMMQRISDAPLDDPASAATVRDALPFWTTRDPLLSVLVAGQATNQSATGRVAPLRIPRTTTSLYDSLFDPRSATPSSSGATPMFPTENPIQTLDDFDRLTIEDKARTLMTISNFEGRLPRPRVVKQSPEVLDQLLLPLIDESARRQYRIREAKRQGDDELARELERQKSQRQIAKEKAELARELGADLEAERWEREAELLASLRADVTQDEGSYSRFL